MHFFMTGICIFEAKTQNKQFSDIKFLSNGIQCVKLLSLKFFFHFSTKSNLILINFGKIKNKNVFYTI